MRVKIVAQFNDEGHDYRHTDLTKPVYADVPDKIAQNWATNGWAIVVPSEEKEPEQPRAVIETPEDQSEVEKRETAAVGRKKPSKS